MHVLNAIKMSTATSSFSPHYDCVQLIVFHPHTQVREVAAASISGLIRCGFINSVHKLKVSDGPGSATV